MALKEFGGIDLEPIFRSWNQTQRSRFWGLCDTIFYYLDLIRNGHTLNDNQRTQLKEARDTICVFGIPGTQMADDVNKAINLD